MTIGEGADIVNPLTQIFPNFTTIDTQMKANEDATVGTATEVTTGTVHAITRANTSNPVFRFTATSAWTATDTMTVDGTSVTVHLSDGTVPQDNTYIIGAEVLAILNGTLVTLLSCSQHPTPSLDYVANVPLVNVASGSVDVYAMGNIKMLKLVGVTLSSALAPGGEIQIGTTPATYAPSWRAIGLSDNVAGGIRRDPSQIYINEAGSVYLRNPNSAINSVLYADGELFYW